MSTHAVPSTLEQPTMKIDEAALLLGVSRTVAYEAARSGELPTIRLGRRIVVPTAVIRRMLQLDEGR